MHIKSIVIVSSLVLTFVVAQITSPTQNYKVTSPVPNAPYAAGQLLPCTVDLLSTSNTDLDLAINLASSFPGSNVILTISTSFIVSRTGSPSKTENNITYYEQSVNYQIPNTVVTGLYTVVFLDKTTNAEVDVPINILGVANNTSSSSATGNVPTTPSPSQSIFKSDGTFTRFSISMNTMNILLVLLIVFLL